MKQCYPYIWTIMGKEEKMCPRCLEGRPCTLITDVLVVGVTITWWYQIQKVIFLLLLLYVLHTLAIALLVKACWLTNGMHAPQGYNSRFVCVSVTMLAPYILCMSKIRVLNSVFMIYIVWLLLKTLCSKFWWHWLSMHLCLPHCLKSSYGQKWQWWLLFKKISV